jgi:hypothetical protein
LDIFSALTLQIVEHGISDLEEQALKAMMDDLSLHVGPRRKCILSVRANRGFKESLRGRKLFGIGLLSCRSKYFGLGSAAMQEGDVLVLIEGGNVPFILRHQDSFHRFVGTVLIPQTAWNSVLEIVRDLKSEKEAFEVR